MTRSFPLAPVALAIVLAFTAYARSKNPPPPLDVKETVPLKPRIACDGQTAPEDHLVVKTTYSAGGLAKTFKVESFRKSSCKVDVVKCFDKVKEGWIDVWSMPSDQSRQTSTLALRSCYEWGQADPAQYVLSAWYKDPDAGPKTPWKQLTVKQVSSVPEVYEFTDPKGGTGRLEIER